MKVCVCEDNREQRDRLKSIIEEWSEKNARPVSVSEYGGASAFLFHVKNKGPFDILFLDIEMGDGLNGMGLAKKVRAEGWGDVIVFTTAMTGYAIEGYKVDAYDYLVKPCAKQGVFAALEYAWARRRDAEGVPCVVLNTDAGKALVDVGEVLYVEAALRNAAVHFVDGSIERVRNSFSELCEALPESRFARTHRSFLINTDHVANFSYGTVTMRGGGEVPIGRKWQGEVSRRLAGGG